MYITEITCPFKKTHIYLGNLNLPTDRLRLCKQSILGKRVTLLIFLWVVWV